MTHKKWLGISFNQHKIIFESDDDLDVLIAIDHEQQAYPAHFNMFQDAELYSIEEIEVIDETEYYIAQHYLPYPPKEEEIDYEPISTNYRLEWNDWNEYAQAKVAANH